MPSKAGEAADSLTWVYFTLVRSEVGAW